MMRLGIACHGMIILNLAVIVVALCKCCGDHLVLTTQFVALSLGSWKSSSCLTSPRSPKALKSVYWNWRLAGPVLRPSRTNAWTAAWVQSWWVLWSRDAAPSATPPPARPNPRTSSTSTAPYPSSLSTHSTHLSTSTLTARNTASIPLLLPLTTSAPTMSLQAPAATSVPPSITYSLTVPDRASEPAYL